MSWRRVICPTGGWGLGFSHHSIQTPILWRWLSAWPTVSKYWLTFELNGERRLSAKNCGKNILIIIKHDKYKEPEAEQSLGGRKSEHWDLKAGQSCLDFILNTRWHQWRMLSKEWHKHFYLDHSSYWKESVFKRMRRGTGKPVGKSCCDPPYNMVET